MGCSLGLTVFADTYKGSVWAFHVAEGINNKLIKINTNEGKLTINTFEGDNNPTGRGQRGKELLIRRGSLHVGRHSLKRGWLII